MAFASPRLTAAHWDAAEGTPFVPVSSDTKAETNPRNLGDDVVEIRAAFQCPRVKIRGEKQKLQVRMDPAFSSPRMPQAVRDSPQPGATRPVSVPGGPSPRTHDPRHKRHLCDSSTTITAFSSPAEARSDVVIALPLNS